MFSNYFANSQETLTTLAFRMEKNQDYKQFVDQRLLVVDNVVLYSAEPQTIDVPPFAYNATNGKRTRSIIFDKIKSHIYMAKVASSQSEIVSLEKDVQAEIHTIKLVSDCIDEALTIIDVINGEEFLNIVKPYIDNAHNENVMILSDLSEVKAVNDDRRYMVYPSAQIEEVESNSPVLVLKDGLGKICYWVCPLSPDQNYYGTDQLILESNIDSLYQKYSNTYFMDKDANVFKLDSVYVNQRSIYFRLQPIVRRVWRPLFMSIDDIMYNMKSMTKDEYESMVRKQKQAEEDERKREELRMIEEERNKELVKQRERLELTRKYGAHYAKCIEEKKVELGMPKDVVELIVGKLSIFSESLYGEDRVEICQGYNMFFFEVISITTYIFTNNILTSISTI